MLNKGRKKKEKARKKRESKKIVHLKLFLFFFSSGLRKEIPIVKQNQKVG